MNSFADLADGAMELTVVPSFSRVGIAARRKLDHWPEPKRLQTERIAVVTGATSGIGRATAAELTRRGASVIAVARNEAKADSLLEELRKIDPEADVRAEIADLASLEDVRALADRLGRSLERIDVLAHVASAMHAERQTSPDGFEASVAVAVLAPFLLTRLTLDQLAESGEGRVLTVSSGGMYTAPLLVEGLEMLPDDYNGVKQYALAKRAQVTLNELWARHHADRPVYFHAMHPGWTDTPGLSEALPSFRRLTKPLLRTPGEGADTLVWLATSAHPEPDGRFWHDRRPRAIHRLGSTRRSDTDTRRQRLWEWCESCV